MNKLPPTWNQKYKSSLIGCLHINEGAANMLKLAASIDTDKMPAPTFMAVIIGVGKYAYRREDGAYVIPIGCLKD